MTASLPRPAPIPRAEPFQAARRAFEQRLPEHFERLAWSPERLRAHQTAALRSLLRTALERSPFHASRLAPHVGDVDSFELEDLSRLPVMTKAAMMARYDEVVTDRRLTAVSLNAFLAAAGPEPSALFDEFIVLASGGSSGTRGVYVQHLSQVPDYVAGIVRAGLARIGQGVVPHDVPFTMVAAQSSVHATRATPPVIDGGVARVTYVPVTLDMSTMLQHVQQSQPSVLVGYAGALAALARAQIAGRLAIRPLMVLSTSEQLTPAAAALLAEAFGVPPANSFASSEGLNGGAPPGDTVFTFASDLAHLEFVDEHDEPVPPATPAHHVLLTNLLNTTQPLIRYRMDDAMTRQAPLPGIGHVRATVQGRADEILRLGDRDVHPHAVRSVLLRTAEVGEYQVRSGGRVLQVDLVLTGAADTETIARALASSLAAAGAGEIDVCVRVVADVERDPRTGKVRRFGPLRSEGR